MAEIIFYMIINALKFTLQGEVSLIISAHACDNEIESSIVQFLIQDTGIGLSSENQTKLFQEIPERSARNQTGHGHAGCLRRSAGPGERGKD